MSLRIICEECREVVDPQVLVGLAFHEIPKTCPKCQEKSRAEQAAKTAGSEK